MNEASTERATDRVVGRAYPTAQTDATRPYHRAQQASATPHDTPRTDERAGFRCCACCKGVALEDHVGHGGSVEIDGHDVSCLNCGMADRLAAGWTHTPASSERGGLVDHCSDCSDAAREWVEWPCSAERIVKAAVEIDRYQRGMDEGARLAVAVARAEALRAEAVEALDSLDLMCQDEDRHGSSIRAHEVRGAVAGLRALADVPTSAPTGEAPW